MMDNKLIAQFMGLQINTQYGLEVLMPPDNATAQGYWVNPQYNSSWDWLMPVVNKIEFVLSKPDTIVMPGWDHWNDQFDGTINTDIKASYQIVVEFIKWHTQTATP